MNDIPQEPERVFIPLALIAAHDMDKTLKLFSWCEKNEIDIIHTCDSMATAQKSIVDPNVGNPGSVMTVTLFYGALENEAHFKKVFGWDYEFSRLAETQIFIDSKISNL